MNDSFLSAIPALAEHSVISHADLDPKNVLWDKEGNPKIIDWESARKLNPTYEIVNACLDWNGITTESFSSQCFVNMTRSYIKAGGKINLTHLNAALYGAIGNMLNWMVWNIERACTNEDLEQKKMGVEQVDQVLKTMTRLYNLIPGLINALDENIRC